MASRPRFFRFSYYTGEREERLRLHHLRDADAFIQIAAILWQCGLEYAGTIFNFPGDQYDEKRPIDISFLRESDVIVLTTRPPLPIEEEKESRKSLNPSNTTLEAIVLKTLRDYFERSLRTEIRLSKPMSGKLRRGYENRADIKFKQTYEANYAKHSEYGKGKKWYTPSRPLTAFYFLLTPPVKELNGSRVMVSFGLDGTMTLIGTYLLRTVYWVYLKMNIAQSRFVMFEFEIGQVRLREVDSLSYFDSLVREGKEDEHILLDATLG